MKKQLNFTDWTDYITIMASRTTLTNTIIEVDKGDFGGELNRYLSLNLKIVVGSNIYKIQDLIEKHDLDDSFLHYNNVSDPIKFSRDKDSYLISVNSFEVMERILNDHETTDKKELLKDIIDVNINDLVEDVIRVKMPLEARDMSLERNIFIHNLKKSLFKKIKKALNL